MPKVPKQAPPTAISIRPDPALVQRALDYCGVALIYGDDHQVRLPPPESRDMEALFSTVVTMCMMRHMEDTMVLPSDLARMREIEIFLFQIGQAGILAQEFGSLGDLKEEASKMAETLKRVIDNLTPETPR